jgi:hypothetical protein
MNMIVDMLFAKNSFSWETAFGLVVAAFGGGLCMRSAIIFKQRKRILRLEDEMLANHSRILTLEKRVAETRKDKNGMLQDYEFTAKRTGDREAKAS